MELKITALTQPIWEVFIAASPQDEWTFESAEENGWQAVFANNGRRENIIFYCGLPEQCEAFIEGFNIAVGILAKRDEPIPEPDPVLTRKHLRLLP